MRVFFATSGDPSGDARLEWEYVGNMCAGTYISSTSVAVLQFFQKTSTVLVTYRILDANSLLSLAFSHVFMFTHSDALFQQRWL